MRDLANLRVEPLHDFLVRLEFADGSTKEIDLSVYLHGPIRPRRRPGVFPFGPRRSATGRSSGPTAPTSTRMCPIDARGWN